MRTLNGLPTKESGWEISFLLNESGLRIIESNPQSIGDCPFIRTICEINYDPQRNTLDHIGSQIVNLIREARDIGFEQGREHIVKALGPSLKKL